MSMYVCLEINKDIRIRIRIRIPLLSDLPFGDDVCCPTAAVTTTDARQHPITAAHSTGRIVLDAAASYRYKQRKILNNIAIQGTP